MERSENKKKKANITRWWLQLQFAFFQDKRVRALRRKYGDISLIIYQKMMLKSLENDCCMKYEGLEDTFEEEIAVDIVEDESEKISLIKDIMEFLIKHDLMIEQEEYCYFFPQAAKMCASETDSAERVRKHRERKKAQEALQCNGGILQCNDTMLQSEVIRKDKNKVREEKELENTLFTSLTLKEGDTPSPSADAGEASPFTFRECVECAVDGKVNLTDDGIQAFYDRMKKDGWVIKGSPVTNLLLAMRGFAKNHKKYQKKATVEKKTFKEWLQYHGYSQDYYEGDGDFDKEIPISEGTIRTVWEVDDLDEHTAVISRRLSELNKAEYKQFSKLFHKWKNGNERT